MIWTLFCTLNHLNICHIRAFYSSLSFQMLLGLGAFAYAILTTRISISFHSLYGRLLSTIFVLLKILPSQKDWLSPHLSFAESVFCCFVSWMSLTSLNYFIGLLRFLLFIYLTSLKFTYFKLYIWKWLLIIFFYILLLLPKLKGRV